MPAHKSIRSGVIDDLIAKNPKLDRSQLERLSNDALVEQAKANNLVLPGSTVVLLSMVDEVGLARPPALADLKLELAKLKPTKLNDLFQAVDFKPKKLSLEVRSSAAYSSGSSDKGMLSSPRRKF